MLYYPNFKSWFLLKLCQGVPFTVKITQWWLACQPNLVPHI